LYEKNAYFVADGARCYTKAKRIRSSSVDIIQVSHLVLSILEASDPGNHRWHAECRLPSQISLAAKLLREPLPPQWIVVQSHFIGYGWSCDARQHLRLGLGFARGFVFLFFFLLILVLSLALQRRHVIIVVLLAIILRSCTGTAAQLGEVDAAEVAT
jgi:hypothetical protein